MFDLLPEGDAIKEFEDYKKEYATINKLFSSSKEKYDLVVNNLDKKNMIKETQKSIYNKIIEIKQLIKDKDMNDQFLKDAVELHVNTLIPLLKKLNDMQYSEMYMEYNEDDETYFLVQQETRLNDLEFIS